MVRLPQDCVLSFFNLLEHKQHPMTAEQSIHDNEKQIETRGGGEIVNRRREEKNHEISHLIFLFIPEDPE